MTFIMHTKQAGTLLQRHLFLGKVYYVRKCKNFAMFWVFFFYCYSSVALVKTRSWILSECLLVPNVAEQLTNGFFYLKHTELKFDLRWRLAASLFITTDKSRQRKRYKITVFTFHYEYDAITGKRISHCRIFSFGRQLQGWAIFSL